MARFASSGLVMPPEAVPQMLADRLTERLAETRGDALVDQPFPWLTRRGLVQRHRTLDIEGGVEVVPASAEATPTSADCRPTGLLATPGLQNEVKENRYPRVHHRR
ncbi:hypothetical protein [Streptomyces daghestanicus]|uniref:Transposase n=1 Tax=Streptomyces daghestanicus TaxID=66885 RepID=A0ABQ3Q7L4_9ACTN|nr:hypothetical protein [Streptomyces daghestanicus]GGU69163.1 hypothetical protein GCM10010259_68780 [Streptomyces daghestanicus]GHI33242.1 hypothetical protein Sdagh_49720 [Streptomyces daghestanicus]